MAFTQLVPQQNRSAPRSFPAIEGVAGDPGVTAGLPIPVGTQRITIRMTSSSWPTGTGNYLLFAMDVSRDGGATWRELAAQGRIEEGARAKDGTMPATVWFVGQEFPPLTQDALIRARFAIPQGTLRFGLEQERV